jgi:hypothetical protein
MQTAGPSIAAFCKAETSLKHIDKSVKNERSELFDCNKTLKDLIKTNMINNSIESIEVDIDGTPHYIRFHTPQPSKKISEEDVLNASKNLGTIFESSGYIPDELVKLMVERLKLYQNKNIPFEKKNIVLCKNKGKEVCTLPNEIPKETTNLVNDLLSVNKQLISVRKKTKDVKKEHVEIKKRFNNDVFESLKQVNGMTRQIQIIDPKNGLRQSMILKANVEKKQQPLGIRTIVPFIKEAAVRSLRKNLSNEEFEEEFRDELMTLIEERPFKETNKVKFMKKSGVEL